MRFNDSLFFLGGLGILARGTFRPETLLYTYNAITYNLLCMRGRTKKSIVNSHSNFVT